MKFYIINIIIPVPDGKLNWRYNSTSLDGSLKEDAIQLSE